MQIEIEKKYNLLDSDYEIIKQKTKFIKKQQLKDYYLDKDYILVKNGYFLRLRNGKYELKINFYDEKTKINLNKEFDNENEINKQLSKIGTNIDETIGVLFVDTIRESYEYNFKGQKICIDIDKYQYGKRYELEIIYNSNENNLELLKDKANDLLNEFVKELGLLAKNDSGSLKITTCAKNQNPKYYSYLI